MNKTTLATFAVITIIASAAAGVYASNSKSNTDTTLNEAEMKRIDLAVAEVSDTVYTEECKNYAKEDGIEAEEMNNYMQGCIEDLKQPYSEEPMPEESNAIDENEESINASIPVDEGDIAIIDEGNESVETVHEISDSDISPVTE